MNTQGTRWRGKLPVPPHAPPLVRRLFALLNSQHTTIAEVADRAGLKRSTVSDWRYSRQPTIGNFEAALSAIGYELSIRPKRGDQ